VTRTLVRAALTLMLLALCLAAIRTLWVRYEVDPMTRDGRVRADIVQIAPDVAGLVTDVRMVDNQFVHKGDVLLIIDQPRYRIAFRQAQRVALAQAIREDRRNRALPDVVPAELIEQGRAKVDGLRTQIAAAETARDLAKLNLERTVVRAPVDGTISNMTLQPGNYLTAGKAAATLVYAQSIRVEGYFEETKMPAIHVGDPAEIHLMGLADPIRGHVESISGGVEDRERSDSESTLANINPSFTWVRLAQRIPVRIAIDKLPPGVQLIVGQTATVAILPRPGTTQARRSWPWA
jgi:RND family efflux transporter MFP subunit